MFSNQSAYYTSVQKTLCHVTSATLKEFASCSTNDDRVAFILDRNDVCSLFACKPAFEAKSASESKASREKGNVHYQKQEYNAALACYSKSVIMAPHPDNSGDSGTSDELTLALGNRSATLYQLHRYNESIIDIDLAFKYHFPAHIQYKLYDRKGRCLTEEGYVDEAIDCFCHVKDSLCMTKLNDKQKDKIVLNSNNQIEQCKNNTSNHDDEKQQSTKNKVTCNGKLPVAASDLCPPEIEPKSKRFAVAAEGFDVKYASSKGRYAVASLNITVGSNVVCERPFASVLDSAQYLIRCFHCFKQLRCEPIPCQQCITVRYCSDDCRQQSWQCYHGWECRYLGLLNASGTGYIAQLALKTVVTAGLPLILKCKRNPKAGQSEGQKALFTDSKGVYMGGFIGLYNLLTHTSKRTTNDLLQYTILSVFLARILENAGFLSSHPKESDDTLMKSVGGALLRFLQIISCNGVEVTEMVRGQNLQKCYPESIGLSLYPAIGLINHSCNPAMELLFYNNCCVARAIRNMAANEELTIDYGYIYYVTPKPQRQMYLVSQYFFDCQCEACRWDWPLRAALKSDIPVLKCIECFSPLSISSAKDPTRMKCRQCGLTQNPLEYFDTLRTSSQAYERALEEARMFNIKKSLPILEEHLILMDTHLLQPWKEYSTCVSTIKQCYRLESNLRPTVIDQMVKF